QYEGFAGFPQWQSYNFYFDPVKTDSHVSFSLVAPSTDKPLGTISAFDDLEVRKVFTNNLLFINKQDEQFTTPKIESEKVSPVKYKIHVSNAKDSHFVVFSENYSPEW